jgi:cysteine-rich repeat protein
MPSHRFAPAGLPAIIVSALAAIFLLGGCPQPQALTCPSGRVCPLGQTCAKNQDICISGLCGNGVKDPGEACDDGNVQNKDADHPNDTCRSDCLSDYTCGNGIVDPGEICDEKDKNGMPGHCSLDCQSNGQCGNGIVDLDEQCDFCIAGDGGGSDGPPVVDAHTGSDAPMSDGSMMSDARMSDGSMMSDGSAMSDGAADATVDASDAAGTGGAGGGMGGAGGTGGTGGGMDAAGGSNGQRCALGITESPTCNSDCTRAFCGDGKLNKAAGEQCDPGHETPGCNSNCTFTRCGDGIVNTAAGEECDPGTGLDTAQCNGAGAGAVACHFVKCGDGYLNPQAEDCEVTNGKDSVTCNGPAAKAGVACHFTKCGDDYPNPAAEDCDSTSGLDSATCNGAGAGAAKCKTPACGDSYINTQAGELCEVMPGGADTPACNGKNGGPVKCKPTACGDGYQNPAAEGCDDSNGADSATCNGTNAVHLACQKPVCGDGYLNTPAGEACDDHNTMSGDGCSSTCQVEGPFTCTKASPSVCTAICGDGITVPNDEACDDFNNNACGTCSAGCSASQTPSQAQATITITGGNSNISFPNHSTFTLSDGVHPPVTFEFTTGQATGTNIAIPDSQTHPNNFASLIENAVNNVGAGLAITARINNSQQNQVLLTNGNQGGGSRNSTISTTNLNNTNFLIPKAPQVFAFSGGVGFDCGTGIGCGSASDCFSGVCDTTTTHKCLAPSCSDGVLNQLETSVDCGGPCSPCTPGQVCIVNADCDTGDCVAGTCQTPSCTNNVKDGNETAVDCGNTGLNPAAPSCPGCAAGKSCLINTDCAQGNCVSGTCQNPTCNDGVQNGNETGVDCGNSGAFPAAPSCASCNGDSCSGNNSCASHHCVFADGASTGTCQP